MEIKKTIIEIFADFQEKRKEAEKTREQRRKEKAEFNYVFNGGQKPFWVK